FVWQHQTNQMHRQLSNRPNTRFSHSSNPDLQSEALHSCILQNLARLARSEGEINELDEGRFLKFVATQSGGTVTLSDLRKQLKQLRMGDIEGENHNEIAQAVHEHINQFGELRYHAGQFWQWKGSHWSEKHEFEIMQTISAEFGFYPSCRKTSDYNGILKLMKSKCAKDLQQVYLKGVNFANGFLDTDLMLRDHHPDYGSTYVLPYRYLKDEAGKMPVCNQFMIDSWGHDPDYDDKVAMFQEMIGATLFGVASDYQQAFCLYGAAGAGKSVASEIVQGLLPEGSVSNIPPEKWSDAFLPAQMHGKLMNYAGELSETKKIAGEHFKQIVAGERITAQHKNQQPFDFRPTCAQWFASNHLPRTSDNSNGFNRRWLFLEWTRPVSVEARTINLAETILSAERTAIAAWAVEGYMRLNP
ncbi:DUF5906 domain-containing protein, partial [Salipiger sp. 1_MG-2023]|uniref:DNA primase family protein n=1 Tax=Salipiger sp. 1_MG-2023 TaxID=3062665 RepID=UPI0026E1B598